MSSDEIVSAAWKWLAIPPLNCELTLKNSMHRKHVQITCSPACAHSRSASSPAIPTHLCLITPAREEGHYAL